MEHPAANERMNGQPGTREMPPRRHQITSPAAEPISRPPQYGLLSRTLVHSSVVKKIIPARIRDLQLNDVAFIGETFVELHLLTGAGKLQQQGIKTDFHADIRDAKVFGTPRTSDIDGPASNNRVDATSPQPPDILALTLDSGHLAFVYAQSCSEQGQVKFIVSKQRIDSRGIHPTHLGKSIAVDPRSRAMAVAAYQDSFRLYSLRSMKEIHQQIANGQDVDPIKDEKTFEVRGLIVHMEFLYPSPNDPEHVILLLFLVDSNHKSRLQLYEWSSNEPLHSAKKYGHHGLRLSDDINIPLHIIPLMIESAFLIVTENATFVAKASDILSGNATFSRVVMPAKPTDGSLITAWARPIRHPVYAGNHDDLYLAMENGDIYFIEADTKGHTLVQTATKASHLDCAIDTAFAALDNGLDSHDILVAGGEMSSGGVYLLEIRPFPVSTEAKLEETVTNWAPVFDFELINLGQHGRSFGGAERDRVFACTGRGHHGAITELRYGVQARILSAADYISGIRRLFILPDSVGKGYFVLTSFGDHSRLLFLSPAGEEDWNECDDELLILEEPTLAAGGFEIEGPHVKSEDAEYGGMSSPALQPWAIQITSSAITVATLNGDQYTGDEVEMHGMAPEGRKLQRKCRDGEFIVGAAVAGNLAILATRDEGGVTLVLASIVMKDGSDEFLVPIGDPIALNDNPTYVGLTELHDENGHDRSVALIGTREATVQLYLCDPQSGLVPVIEQRMMDNTIATQREADLFFCESGVIIQTQTAAMLLCGLRGGTVLIFSLTISSGSLRAEPLREIKFGPIAVQVHSDVRRKDSAFLLAGPELYRFDMPQDVFRATQVIFRDSHMDPAIQALVQVDNSPDPENIIVCATSDQIFYADVGQSERLCGRRLRLYETPRRLLLHNSLNVFIVACSRTVQEEVSRRTSGGGAMHAPTRKRISYCSLKFLDPFTGDLKGDETLIDSQKRTPIFPNRNEQIYCLAELNMRIGDNTYQFIGVGTGTLPSEGGGEPPSGRLLIITVAKNQASGKIEVRRRFNIVCDAPVYSLAQYGVSSFIYSSGAYVHMKSMKDLSETKRLTDAAKIYIRSPAVHISVEEPYIYLSCASDSILVLRFDTLGAIPKLTECFSDEVARNGFHHMTLTPSLVLATDKQYSVVGLWRPSQPRALESMTTVFEAELSSSISRIRRGSCRPPWSRPNGRLPGVVTGLKERGQEENEERAILAAGVDGSFFQLTVLERDAVRLLRVVMQIYSQLQQQKQQEASAATAMGAGIPPATTGGFGDSQLGPHASSITYLDEDYDDDFGGVPRHEWNPEDAHIDGDALIPITTLPKGWLRRAVDRDDAMKARFEQVARRVLDGPDGPRQQRQGQQRDAEEPREDEEEDDICDRVCRWIEELLTDAVL